MPRSHRFEHSPEGEADPDRARRDKQDLAAQSSTGQAETEVHYGKRFAETEAILKARAEERAAHDESGAPDEHLGSTDAQVSPTPAQPSTGAVADETGMPGMARAARPRKPRDRRRGSAAFRRDETPPLGSMPSEELPAGAEQVLAETPAELVGAFRDQVTRSIRAVGDAGRQLRTAGREVAGLPVEALRLALRIGRSWLGRSPRRA